MARVKAWLVGLSLKWKIVLAVVAVFVVLGVIEKGFLEHWGEGAVSAEPTTSRTRTFSAPVPTPAPVAVPAAPSSPACGPAPVALVELINQSFTGGEQLARATAVNAPRDMVYIAGDIEAGGQRVSSADVWLYQHGAILALSSDARKRTMFADGRDFASAGDEYGTAAQDCISR